MGQNEPVCAQRVKIDFKKDAALGGDRSSESPKRWLTTLSIVVNRWIWVRKMYKKIRIIIESFFYFNTSYLYVGGIIIFII